MACGWCSLHHATNPTTLSLHCCLMILNTQSFTPAIVHKPAAFLTAAQTPSELSKSCASGHKPIELIGGRHSP